MTAGQKIGISLFAIATIVLITVFLLSPLEPENKKKDIILKVLIAISLTLSWFLTGCAIGMLIR